MCRHATGVLQRLGHRNLALVIARSQLAGDLESEAGFLEGVKNSGHPEVDAVVCRHDGTVASIGHGLLRLIERKVAPTAILVATAYHYLTVVSLLGQMGRHVPQEVSVISRDDDVFVSYLVPLPARYSASAHTLAKSLAQPVLEVLEQETPARRELRLMPEFIRGESISTARPR